MTRIRDYILILLIVILSTGCSGRTDKEVDDALVFPEYASLLKTDLVLPQPEESIGEYPLPVRVYMDNTGSMQAFIFNENMECQADPEFVRLMRTIRDMERIFYDTCYYTIQQNEQTGMIRDWTEYNGSIYQDFENPEFYFSWKKNSDDGNVNGPLSMLYLDEGRLNPKYINVVMTDLAEQNVNNTYLAQQIQEMCEKNECDAYMLAFQFDYHGEAEVADPNRLNEIISRRVDGSRPYYVIFTGPSQYIGLYMKRFQESLSNMQMYEYRNYFFASSGVAWDQSTLDWENLEIEKSASYDQIKQEVNTGEISGLSKNISQYEETEQLFGDQVDSRLLAFYYAKEDGVSKAQNDWRLNFRVPLKKVESNGTIKYDVQAEYYQLEQIVEEEETFSQSSIEGTESDESDSEELAEREEPRLEWKMIKKPTFDVSIEMVQDDAEEKQKFYAVKLSGKPDKELEKDCILMILTVMQEEVIPYKQPDWIDQFDSGTEDDYFQKTYNLAGFYDVLFGHGYLTSKDEKLVSKHVYAEIPILITGLRGGNKR